MDLEEKYKKETGFDVGKIHEIGVTYYSDDYVKWLEKAIDYTRCCETVKENYTHTFEVDLNSEKRKEQYNKQIEQIHNAPCKVYLYDGENYIELKP